MRVVRLSFLLIALVALAGCPSGDDGDSAYGQEAPMNIQSNAMNEGETIPEPYTCEGEDKSPPLYVESVPTDARSLALIVDDPYAGPTPWVHWLIWNVPAEEDKIPEGYPPSGSADAFDEARQGTNSFSNDNQRYRGPCPPPGDGEHRYRFTLYALERTLGLEEGAERDALEDAMEGNLIEEDRLTGVYER